MYTHGNYTCEKGGDGEFTRIPTGTVPAEKGGEREIACSPVETIPAEWKVRENLHVHPWKLYLWKRRDDKTACISAENEMQIRNDVNKIRK